MAKTMSADERRAYMENAIREGGSVLHHEIDHRDGIPFATNSTLRTRIDQLPSKGDLAATPDEKRSALEEIRARRRALDAEEARLAGEQTDESDEPDDSDELPEDFPARAALVDAGYETKSSLVELSDDELTALHGIGPATAQKIRAALAE